MPKIPGLPDSAQPIEGLPDSAIHISEPEDSSLFQKSWKAISQPLTDLPSRFAKSVADYIDAPSLERSPTMASIQGFGAGALQGLGDVVSGATSPLNLAAMATTGGASMAGRMGLPALATGLETLSTVPNAMMAGHGLSEMVSPDKTLGERGFGLAEAAGGIAGLKGGGLKKVAEKVKEPTPYMGPASPEEALGRLDQSIRGQEIAAKPVGSPQIEAARSTINEPISEAADTGIPKYKMGTKVIIKSDKATPEMVKKAREQGFTFDSVNDQGHFRFIKTEEPSPTQPVLESEIGTTRPTRQQMGPETDIRKPDFLSEALSFPRSVMASTDMSAPLRQGLGLIHKPQFWQSIPSLFKAFGSEEAFNQIQQSIADKPLFRPRAGPNDTVLPSFAEDAGLKLTDLVNKKEEALRSNWAEQVPGFGQVYRASERSYTAFLNKLRADTFESLINSGKVIGADGETNIPLARGLADFVNTATGRGSLGKLEGSAKLLSNTFFAPRLIASRMQLLNPNYYIMADPMVRKEALKSLFAIAGTGTTIGQLAKMAGADVETDPVSSDFGKIKIGNVRLDPFAGFQQYIVAANRLVQGRTKSSTSGQEYNLGEKFGRQTRLDVLGRFAESKLNPALSFATSMLRGKDFTGQPFNIPEAVAQRFTPIFLQDLKQLATENPDLLGGYQEFHPENIPYAVPSWFGMGVQQYGPK